VRRAASVVRSASVVLVLDELRDGARVVRRAALTTRDGERFNPSETIVVLDDDQIEAAVARARLPAGTPLVWDGATCVLRGTDVSVEAFRREALEHARRTR
jgi:hypothetical protein